ARRGRGAEARSGWGRVARGDDGRRRRIRRDRTARGRPPQRDHRDVHAMLDADPEPAAVRGDLGGGTPSPDRFRADGCHTSTRSGTDPTPPNLIPFYECFHIYLYCVLRWLDHALSEM